MYVCTCGHPQSGNPSEQPISSTNPAPSDIAAMSINLQLLPPPQNNVCLLKAVVAIVTH